MPRTYPVSDRASLNEAWDALDRRDLTWCRIRRGAASRGATMVRDADQAWSWISYWHTMRGVPVEDFTLSEFLPGRDYNVQGIWSEGRLILIKMCERLSYLNASQQPSGMASTPALAKTVWEAAAIECVRGRDSRDRPSCTWRVQFRPEGKRGRGPLHYRDQCGPLRNDYEPLRSDRPSQHGGELRATCLRGGRATLTIHTTIPASIIWCANSTRCRVFSAPASCSRASKKCGAIEQNCNRCYLP